MSLAKALFRAVLLAALSAGVVSAETYTSVAVPLAPGEFPIVRLQGGAGTLASAPAILGRSLTSLPAKAAAGGSANAAGETFRVLAVLDSPSRVPSLLAAGLQPVAHVGPVVSIDVDPNQLRTLLALPGVKFVRPPQLMRMHLNVNGVENGAVEARQQTGLMGAGTAVAVIDSGIDYTHADFRHPDGTTRIKWLWDQFDQSYRNSGGTIGSAPPVNDSQGRPLGTVYSEAQLNAALQGAGTVNSVDLPGHGTLVASAAAGNGLATGNGQPAGIYVGTAPEADILAVRVGGTSKTDFNITGDIIAALDWIDARANELGEPVVVNMSFGGHVGPHDGTTPEELAIDSFVTEPGRAVVVSAGNEGAMLIHATGSDKGSHTLHILNAAQDPDMEVDCWLPGSDIVDVGFLDPTGAGQTNANVTENSCAVVSSSVNKVTACVLGLSPANGDREVLFFVEPTSSAAPISAGEWQFMLRDEGGVVDGHFDCWSALGQQFSADADGIMSVAQPGTASGAITVGALSARNEFPSMTGTTFVGSITLGALAPFSSIGPTRDGRLKPDLTTGGNRVVGAWSIGDGTGSGIARVPADPSLITPDGFHVASQGTSFSAPQVAGAVALLFEAVPDLDGAEAKSVLTDTARSDSFTGTVPNTRWGYGKLDVLAAVDSLLGATPTDASPTATQTQVPTATMTPTSNRTPTDTPRAASHGGGGGCAIGQSGFGTFPGLWVLGAIVWFCRRRFISTKA